MSESYNYILDNWRDVERGRIAGDSGPVPEGYHVYTHGGSGSFLGFMRNDFDSDEHYRNGDGWKFHLTIHPKDLSKAWDRVIAPILTDAGVGGVKFAAGSTLDRFSDPNNSQAGKTITIYGAGNLGWDQLARKLEAGLAREGIRPGPAQIAGDKMVEGSRYIGYRNEKRFGLPPIPDFTDSDANPQYISAKEIREHIRLGNVPSEMSHNPAGQPDSLANINLANDPLVMRAREGIANAAASAAKPPGFFERAKNLLFGAPHPADDLNENELHRDVQPAQPAREQVAQGREISPARGWSNYQSSAFGDSMRHDQPFPTNGVNCPTPDMQRFQQEMHGKGVAVEWGFKGNYAYAYVPVSDAESMQNLGRAAQPSTPEPVRPVTPEAAPEKATPAVAKASTQKLPITKSRTSNASYSVLHDLQYELGDRNILGVERINGAYHVTVPATYSRSNFVDAGIKNVDQLARPGSLQTASTHVVVIPEGSLPEGIARDAKVFDALDRAGISDASLKAFRSEDSIGKRTYVIDVPDNYSRENLAAAGINPSKVTRENLGGGVHRITIPLEASAAILNARVENAIPSTPDRAAPFPAPDQFGRSTTPRNGLSMDPLVYTERSDIERLPPLDMEGLQRDLRAKGHAALEEAGMTRTPPEAFGRRAVDDAGVAAANEPRNAESVRTASQPDTMPARGGASTGLPRVAGGAVAGMSAYMIAQKVGPNGTLGEDVRHGGTRAALASASLAADTTAAVADVAEVTGKAKGALGALARRATPVAVVAGAMEFGTAISAKDGHRAANAAGATAGGILGGIAAGASAGFVMGTVFPGAGNVAGAVVGGAVGLIGGIAGAIGGGALTEAVAGDALDAHLNNRAAGDDWRSKQAKAAQERQREAAAKSGQVHRSFAGRAGAQHLNQELGEIAGQFASTNWGKHIGNGDKNVTAQELRQEMQQHGITVAEIDRNRDGNITGKEMTDALNAHGVQHDRGNPQQAPARTAPPRDWRAEQAKAAQERQREAAAQSGKVHSSFAGRAGAQHLNAELKGLEGELTKAGWGRLIGNGDANVTVAELRATMQKHGITVAEMDRNGDGNITGREVTNALKGHGIGNGQRPNGGQGR